MMIRRILRRASSIFGLGGINSLTSLVAKKDVMSLITTDAIGNLGTAGSDFGAFGRLDSRSAAEKQAGRCGLGYPSGSVSTDIAVPQRSR